MSTEKALNEKILKITEKIRENYPELLKHLNELTETIPAKEDPEINLGKYYDSLVNLVNKYEESHTEKVLESVKVSGATSANSDLIEEVNSMSLSYNYAGEGAVPILFLHGFPFDKSMWKEQIDSLKDSFCTIAIDIRGFGKSTDEETDLSIDLFTDDLVAFMDRRNIEKAIVCGLSMGGYIALNAVKRFPERFEALILADTQCISDSAEAKEKRMKTVQEIKQNGATEFNEKFIKSVFHPDSLQNKTELVDRLREVVFANSTRIITAGLTALAERPDSCSSLRTITIPTLIICGAQDELTLVAQSQFMHENIKGSVLQVIQSAGHVSNLEQPEEFNKYLHEFLNKVKDNRVD
ncbi:alpha/beta fold hydrolase [Flavobacterium weaverense]|uniref:Pimeloyl-ACP methyl ester carboxylesterase n=1 Tax=Flavobacterium weaverense TaxID=271156 RepID=A0A3L9ZUW7_9FLAO|nr:alpha/beta hydrolase [Flavobacterium weaverense]RMA76167.1 pimeloyl-ACP methyl ester carboxylesterase [Flavobacterium weaverense]